MGILGDFVHVIDRSKRNFSAQQLFEFLLG